MNIRTRVRVAVVLCLSTAATLLAAPGARADLLNVDVDVNADIPVVEVIDTVAVTADVETARDLDVAAAVDIGAVVADAPVTAAVDVVVAPTAPTHTEAALPDIVDADVALNLGSDDVTANAAATVGARAGSSDDDAVVDADVRLDLGGVTAADDVRGDITATVLDTVNAEVTIGTADGADPGDETPGADTDTGIVAGPGPGAGAGAGSDSLDGTGPLDDAPMTAVAGASQAPLAATATTSVDSESAGLPFTGSNMAVLLLIGSILLGLGSLGFGTWYRLSRK